MRIVITDCDHDAIAEERRVAEAHGVDLELFQCRSEDDVIAAAAGADAIVVQYAPITARVLDALPGLRAIGRYGVGVDTIDVAAATARGVAVCNVPDYGTEDVSDHAIALALSLVRGVTELDRRTRAGSYGLSEVKPLHRISALTFGVVGVGRIGTATARKAAALGFSVLGHDPRPDTRVGDVRLVGFHELLREADVVSLHVPLDERTRHLIDDGALSQMKPGAVLVNTCRGGVVDTEALVRALRSGRVKAAALDVFEQEPLPRTSALLQVPSVVVTPHTAWYSEESESELKRRAIENVVDYCAGRDPRDLLNPEVRS
ncbi:MULTISPECIES: C-terminal binding protein [Microbacterium]|uniref:C-terminal binding protein n=1 Tax=Microbacterium TaxID=33882 RepID=UPI0028E34758|nr:MULTISPECIES: C-terminal binding protein [Microbacterium]